MDPLASYGEKKLGQSDVDSIIAKHRAKVAHDEAAAEDAKSISIKLGDFLKVQVRLRHVITGATVASLMGGGWGYWRTMQPSPESRLSAEARVLAAPPENWSERLLIVEQNQHAMKESMIEQKQDIREMRNDIRAIRTIMEKAK